MMPDKELLSIAQLLSDSDSFVREAVKSRLVQRGIVAVEYLESELLSKEDREEGSDLDLFIQDVKLEIYIDNLRVEFSFPEPILQNGLYWVNKVVDESIDQVLFFNSIEQLYVRVVSESFDDKTAFEQIKIFNYLFFDVFDFKHTDIKMTSLESASIERALLSRSANPIVLTLIYFLISRMSGLPIYPLCFKGGFVPVYLDNNGKILFYLNIFKKGDIFSEDTLMEYIKDLNIELFNESLRIEQERALVSIYCEMLYFVSKRLAERGLHARMQKVIDAIGGPKYL